MKIKTVELNGKIYAELSDGKPVYVHDDGKEVPFDAAGTVATISRLNAEAKTHREAKEAALTKLASFEGITDVEAALKALKTVSNLDAKKLIDAGEADRVKLEAVKATEAKFKPIIEERDKLTRALADEKIGGGFARSKFIAEKVAVPVPMMEATFGHNFKVEDGKLVAYDNSGNKIYSRIKSGELADMDEALEMIVDTMPFKDSILKGTGASGSGAPGGSNKLPGGRTMKRAHYDNMSPADRDAAVKAGTTFID